MLQHKNRNIMNKVIISLLIIFIILTFGASNPSFSKNSQIIQIQLKKYNKLYLQYKGMNIKEGHEVLNMLDVLR
mgnify:CR=1 FL=1